MKTIRVSFKQKVDVANGEYEDRDNLRTVEIFTVDSIDIIVQHKFKNNPTTILTELQNICFEYVKNNFESIAEHLKTIDTHHGRLYLKEYDDDKVPDFVIQKCVNDIVDKFRYLNNSDILSWSIFE